MWWDVSGMSIIMHSSLQDGTSPLMWACRTANAEVVRIFISAGAHVNDQDNVSSTRPMTLSDLYPDVKLYTEVETIIIAREVGGKMGGGSGRTYGKGRRGRRLQGVKKGAQEWEKSEVSRNYLHSLGERDRCGEWRWCLPSSHVQDLCC